MELVKIELMSKNNKQRGSYLYMPIVLIEGEYYRCSCIKTDKVIKKSDVELNTLSVTSKILPEYYAANGIQPINN